MLSLWINLGLLTGASNSGAQPTGPTQRDGDGFRRKLQIVYRPKAEKQLDDVIAIIEDINPTSRVSVNKAKIKSAIAAIKEIEPPPNYAGAIESLTKSLIKVSRGTALHEGSQVSIAEIVNKANDTLDKMEYRRLRDAKDLEAIWLLS
jgi:hypothetical protein